MALKTDLYIDGKWVKGSTTVPVRDPSDDSVIAEIQIATEKECDAAVAEAAMKSGVAQKKIEDIAAYKDSLAARLDLSRNLISFS